MVEGWPGTAGFAEGYPLPEVERYRSLEQEMVSMAAERLGEEITTQAGREITDRRGWRRWRHPGRAVYGAVAVLLAVLATGGWSSGSAAGGARHAGGAGLQASLSRELGHYLATRGKAEHISVVSLRVSFGGKPAIDLAAGTTRYGGGARLSPGALWQIGSNTKAFTSVLLLQLEAEGKLSISDTLGKWLPQYPAWRNITIERLLNMTSGIPDYYAQPAFQRAFAADPGRYFSAARLVSYAYAAGLPLQKGWNYSNTNYILAQMIIERAGHDSYPDQLRRRIIIPLGLHDTFYGPQALPAAVAARQPAGYFFDSSTPLFASLLGEQVPKLALSSAQGAGAIISSLSDLTTWDRALYQGRELPGPQQRQLESLVSEKTGLPITTTTPADPAGFGLGVAQFTSPVTGTFWAYEGATYGYRVQHIYLPSSGAVIALAVNSATAANDDQLGPLALAIYQILQKAGALQGN
jgi:D-alanyl-D-alanine carboxypeptidase